MSDFTNQAQTDIEEPQAKLHTTLRKPCAQHMCALSPPIPAPCWAKPAETRNLHPLPLPALKPAKPERARGLCPPFTSPRRCPLLPVNALGILSLRFPADSSNDRLSPPRGPRTRGTCPQGPGRRTSRPPPPIQVRPAPRRSTNPRLHALPHQGAPNPQSPGTPSPAGSPSTGSARGARGAGPSARARFGRRAPTWPWERARGGPGPPASPPDWRVAGEGDPTGRGAPHLPRRDRSSARLRLPPRGHSSASRARSEYIPSSGGPGLRGGPRAGPGSAAPATPPLSRSDEWLQAPGGAATARRDTSAPPAPALTPRRGGGAVRGRGLTRHSFPGPMGTPLGVRSAGGLAPRRAAGGERCAQRPQGGAWPEPGGCRCGPALRVLASPASGASWRPWL